MLPGLSQFRDYRRGWLRGDILAGLTVAAYLVPQVMAYAEVAGLPPVVGLWAIIGTACCLRPTRVVPAAVDRAGVDDRADDRGGVDADRGRRSGPVRRVGRHAGPAGRRALPAGEIGRTRLPRRSAVQTRPGRLHGRCRRHHDLRAAGEDHRRQVDGDEFAPQIASFLGRLDQLHWPTVILATALVVLLFTLHRLVPRLPGPLITVALATAVVALFSLQDYGILVVGAVPAGLPTPAIPSLSIADLQLLIVPAIGVAFVAYTDNVLTARAFALRPASRSMPTRNGPRSPRANISASLFHGFPVSSSGSRTALGAALGSRTQLYSLVALLLVLSTLVVAGPLLAGFPKAALGALVIFAAVRLIDVGELRRFARFRRSELLLAVMTTIAVLGVGVLYGVLAAVALSVIDLCAGSLTHTTESSGTCRESPGCTTSTTTRWPARFPAWSSTATTPRCVSPTRRTSANGP